jgi:hypothetical protein
LVTSLVIGASVSQCQQGASRNVHLNLPLCHRTRPKTSSQLRWSCAMQRRSVFRRHILQESHQSHQCGRAKAQRPPAYTPFGRSVFQSKTLIASIRCLHNKFKKSGGHAALFVI